jgi:hypothetical protein
MAVPVMIGVLVGLVVGGAAMALWAASRIGEEAARQFDRGFERGRWLADLSVTRALEPPQRTPRAHLLIPNGTRDQPDPGPALLHPYSSWHAEVPPTAQLGGIDRK